MIDHLMEDFILCIIVYSEPLLAKATVNSDNVIKGQIGGLYPSLTILPHQVVNLDYIYYIYYMFSSGHAPPLLLTPTNTPHQRNSLSFLLTRSTGGWLNKPCDIGVIPHVQTARA